jgi:hypothetical protein
MDDCHIERSTVVREQTDQLPTIIVLRSGPDAANQSDLHIIFLNAKAR